MNSIRLPDGTEIIKEQLYLHYIRVRSPRRQKPVFVWFSSHNSIIYRRIRLGDMEYVADLLRYCPDIIDKAVKYVDSWCLTVYGRE